MKKKIVGTIKSYEGEYTFYIDDIEEIAEILKSGYGGCDIDLTEYELDDITELSQIPGDSLDSVRISAPPRYHVKVSFKTNEEEQQYLKAEKESRTTGLTFWLSPFQLFLSIQNKTEFKAIGVATKLENVIERARTDSAEEAGISLVKPIILLSRRMPEDTKGSKVSEATAVLVVNSVTVDAIKSPVAVSSIGQPVSIEVDRRPFLKRNKDKLLIALISALLGAGLATLVSQIG